MSANCRNLLIGVVLSFSLLALVPAPAQGDDYWDGYWGWYDNTYRPYYYRQYVGPYRSGYTYGPGYYSSPGAVYYGPRYYQYGAPYGAYYGGPNVGYSDFGPYGAQVRVGPVRFGWR